MEIEFTGKVHAVLPLATGVGRNGPWARATVVFSVANGRYEDKIPCENSRDAEKFAKLQVGQEVHVKADINAREYQGKWYPSILCYEFTPKEEPKPAAAAAADDGDDGLPF